MIIYKLLREIRNNIYCEESEIMFRDAMMLCEALYPEHHFKKRLVDRLDNIKTILLPEELSAMIPKVIRHDVKGHLIAQVQTKVAEALKSIYTTPFYKGEDMNKVIVLKIAVIRIVHKGKIYPVKLIAEYEGKKKSNEGTGDMFYCIWHNEKGITFILGNSDVQDKKLMDDAMRHYYDPQPIGCKVMSIRRESSQSSNLIVKIDLNDALRKLGGESDEQPALITKPKQVDDMIHLPKNTKIDNGSKVKIPDYGDALVVDHNWVYKANGIVKLYLSFINGEHNGENKVLKVKIG
jgi:hypothetical protein